MSEYIYDTPFLQLIGLCGQKMPSTELFSYHYHRIWQRLRVGNFVLKFKKS